MIYFYFFNENGKTSLCYIHTQSVTITWFNVNVGLSREGTKVFSLTLQLSSVDVWKKSSGSYSFSRKWMERVDTRRWTKVLGQILCERRVERAEASFQSG